MRSDRSCVNSCLITDCGAQCSVLYSVTEATEATLDLKRLKFWGSKRVPLTYRVAKVAWQAALATGMCPQLGRDSEKARRVERHASDLGHKVRHCVMSYETWHAPGTGKGPKAGRLRL
ncbi:hypothetical protein L6452_22672 [Arctium lappa]|uniref:Uncharacterized protein n=1 Tax=Arctium lappa TaxID=4217 RepID=A0ACB9B0F7_ARCLA|nr:hypothetical protein L6452_22672 [Arctium lappa]